MASPKATKSCTPTLAAGESALKQASPSRASSIARRQVLAATKVTGCPLASATKSFRNYIQNKTPSSQSKGYRQYMAASSNVRTNRRHRNPGPKRSLTNVNGLFCSAPQDLLHPKQAALCAKSLETCVPKREIGTLSVTPTKSILKAESKYKYPRGSKQVHTSNAVDKPRLRWWDMVQTEDSFVSKAGGDRLVASEQNYEQLETVATLVSSPSQYSPLAPGALACTSIEPLALQLDTSEDECASSSIGLADMPLDNAFVPWIVEASSPKSTRPSSVKRPSVLDILEKRNGRGERASTQIAAKEESQCQPARPLDVDALKSPKTFSAGERIVEKSLPARKKRKTNAANCLPGTVEATRESRKGNPTGLDLTKPWGDVWHVLKQMGWRWVKVIRSTITFTLCQTSPRKNGEKWV